MNDQELTAKVKQLRSQYGRRIESSSSSGASEDTERHTAGVNQQKRGTGKGLSGTDSSATSGTSSNRTGTRKSESSDRSDTRPDTRYGTSTNIAGQDQRGPISSRSDHQGTITNRGRLAREDDIPERKETTYQDGYTPIKRPIGRPRKEVPQAPGVQVSGDVQDSFKRVAQEGSQKVSEVGKQVFNWFKAEGRIISEAEAEDLIPKIGKAFVDYGSYVDQYLQWKLNRPTDVFFSDLSYEEGEVLARLIIRLGKRDAKIAGAARTIASGNDYLNAIIVLWPRVSKLVEAIRPDTTGLPERNVVSKGTPIRFFRRTHLVKEKP